MQSLHIGGSLRLAMCLLPSFSGFGAGLAHVREVVRVALLCRFNPCPAKLFGNCLIVDVHHVAAMVAGDFKHMYGLGINRWIEGGKDLPRGY